VAPNRVKSAHSGCSIRCQKGPIVWLLVALLFRYSSLAALIAVAAAPVAAWFLADGPTAGLALFLAIVIWLRHHENIARLLKGQESKIRLGGSKTAAG